MNAQGAYNIIIIRPRGYIWSSVFFELAELISFSLRDLGYSASITENKTLSSAINIFLGAHLLGADVIDRIPKNSIIFNTEQIGEGPDRWNKIILLLVSRFTTWDYSLTNIEKLASMGMKRPHFFKLGYHPRLQRIPLDVPKDIDVLFYGSVNPVRKKILIGLKDKGLNVVNLAGVFGIERDAFIARTKLVLNLHLHGSKILELVRIHYLMNNQKVILTQYDADSVGGEDHKEGLLLAAYEDIVDKAVGLLNSPEDLAYFSNKSLSTIQGIDSVEVMRKIISI